MQPEAAGQIVCQSLRSIVVNLRRGVLKLLLGLFLLKLTKIKDNGLLELNYNWVGG